MYPARKHLEAEHEFGVQGGERGHGLQLPAMVIGIVVRFAEQCHLRCCGAREDFRRGNAAAARHGPRADGDAALMRARGGCGQDRRDEGAGADAPAE